MSHVGVTPTASGGSPVSDQEGAPFVSENLLSWLHTLSVKIEGDDHHVHNQTIMAMQDRRLFYLSTPYVIEGVDGSMIPISMVERMSPDEYESAISQVNFLASFVNQNVWQLAATKPAYSVVAPDSSKYGKAAARVAQALVKYTETKEWGEIKRQDFALNALLCGTALLGLQWNPNSGPKCKEPIYKEIEVEDGEPLRVQCGEREGRMGMPELSVPDPIQFKADLSGSNTKDIMYLRRRRRLHRGIILQTYPKAKLVNSSTSPTDYAWFEEGRYRASASVNRSTTAMGNSFADERVEFGQYWIHPAVYERVQVRDSVKLESLTIEAGTKLRDLFPDGMYFACVGSEILDIAPSYLSEEWYAAHLKRVSGRWWGHTFVEDMVRCQDDINQLETIAIKAAMYNASPMTLIDGQAVNIDDLSGDTSVVVVRGGAMEGRGVDAFVRRIPGQGVDSQSIGLKNMLIEAMRQFSAAYTGGGIAGGGPRTAEEIRYMSAQAASTLSPTLDEFSQVRIATIRQYLRLYQKNWRNAADYDSIGGDFSREDVACFLDYDTDEFDITVDERSRMPVTELDKQVNVEKFAQIFLLNRQLFTPKELNLFAQLYGIQNLGLTDEADRRRAHDRIKRVEAAVQALSENAELSDEIGQIIEEIVAPDPDVDSHETMIDEYREMLKSKDAETMHPVLIEAIRAAIRLHNEVLTAQNVQAQQVAAQGQIATIQAQAAAQAEPPPVDSSPVSEEESAILQAPPQEAQLPELPGGGPAA